MTPEDLARQSLSTDAAFCTASGTAMVALSPFLGPWLGLPKTGVAVTGAATGMWGGWVLLAAGAPHWRTPTKVVATVNTAATVALATLAAGRPTKAGRIAVGLVATDVAALAGLQLGALVLDRRARAGEEIGAAPEPAPGTPSPGG